MALIRVVTAPPVGGLEDDLLGAHRLPRAQPLGQGELLQGDLPPVGPPEGQHFEQLLRRAAGRAQVVDDPPRLPVDRRHAARLRVEDQDAHGSRVHQGLQAGPGPLFLPVPAGVGDDQRRLGGEHHQGLLVLGGELHFLLAHVEGPDALPQAADGRGQEGQNGADRHRRAELGKAQRPGVAVEVPQSQRFGNPAEALEELQPFGQLHKSLALFRSQPGGDEVLYPPRLVQQGDDAVAGAGQRAGAVQDPLQHRVEVEALVDAQAGLAQPGQPVPQLRYLPLKIVCLFHFLSSNRAAYDHEPPPGRTWDSGRARPGQPQL